MALFFAEDPHRPHGRLTGFDRYRELLGRDHMSYLLGGFVTLLGFVPFAAGMALSFLSSSALVMLAAGVLGGMIAGPFLYALYDLLYRSYRNASANWWAQYRRALRENWKSALAPGAVLCVFAGAELFTGFLLFWWAVVRPGIGTLLVYGLSALLAAMLFSLYWPQLVLFRQSGAQRLKNCLLFCLKYFWKVLGIAAIQVLYWALLVVLLPWSLLALPVIGIWFVLFLANFLIYPEFDAAFRLEEQIEARFPGQIRPDEPDDEP